jgi:hypothetical protein
MHDDGKVTSADGLGLPPDAAEPTSGQRRRIDAFRSVEGSVRLQIEELCSGSGSVEVGDVAVLVVMPEAHPFLFGSVVAPDVTAFVGHRRRVRDMLVAALPPVPGAPDPYVDLDEVAPPCCARVLV